MASTPTISLRLPRETRRRLDEAAARSHRSRSSIIQRAIDLHLDEALGEGDGKQASDLQALLRMQGSGIGSEGGISKEEIDRHVRWLRDDD